MAVAVRLGLAFEENGIVRRGAYGEDGCESIAF